jgi:peptidoglycan/LPS O-acetylase OafA/YrhL
MRSWPRLHRVLFFAPIGAFLFAHSAVYGGPVRLAMFVAGILVYEALESKAGPPLDRTGLAALAIGLVTVSVLKGHDVSGVPNFVVLFVTYFLLCYSCFRGKGTANEVFCWTPLRWLGNMSYSYFLIHGLTLRVAYEGLAIFHPPLAQETWIFWLLLAPMFLLSLIPAGMLFVAVEKPYSLGGKPVQLGGGK